MGRVIRASCEQDFERVEEMKKVMPENIACVVNPAHSDPVCGLFTKTSSPVEVVPPSPKFPNHSGHYANEETAYGRTVRYDFSLKCF